MRVQPLLKPNPFWRKQTIFPIASLLLIPVTGPDRDYVIATSSLSVPSVFLYSYFQDEWKKSKHYIGLFR